MKPLKMGDKIRVNKFIYQRVLNLRFRHQIKPDFKHQGVHIDLTWDMPDMVNRQGERKTGKNMAREFAVGRIDVHLSFLIYDEC